MLFTATHIYICDFHKARIQCARTRRRRKDSEDDSNETDTDLPEVDLYQLQVNTLRRYKRHYKVSTRPGMNKAQLADVSVNNNLIYNYDTITNCQSCVGSALHSHFFVSVTSAYATNHYFIILYHQHL